MLCFSTLICFLCKKKKKVMAVPNKYRFQLQLDTNCANDTCQEYQQQNVFTSETAEW